MNKEQILSIVRQVLTALGVILLTTGVMQDGMFSEISGAIMTLISSIWSIVDKTDGSMTKKLEAFQSKMKNK